jgi:hypothetical protein
VTKDADDDSPPSKPTARGGRELLFRKSKARTGGAKLARSETVTVRLDPRLRYFAELAARTQRRTLSSFVEWAIEQSLSNICLEDSKGDFREPSIAGVMPSLWDVDEADRFAKLALRYPETLLHEEQVLWKLIRENGCLWKGQFDQNTNQWTWRVSLENLVFERLRKYWDALCSVAYDDGSKELLPTWTKQKQADPDDIPF